MKTKILVTAGGTKVRIDDVRFVGNFSKGKFGLAIAREFAVRGAEVHVLASDDAVDREGLRESHPFARLTPYAYFEDFRDGLYRAIEEEKPDVIVMAAAVSDWLCADAQGGKIDSSAPELALRFVRAPKLIASLRERCGVGTFLVGFKLLSGATREELMVKAHRQVRDNRLNLTVANDLGAIRDGRHPIVMVTPEGGEIAVEGGRQHTASALVDFILRRRAVRWTRSVNGGGRLPVPPDDEAFRQAGALIRFSQEANLYSGTDGNLSWRVSENGGLLVSPRQTQKARLTPDDLVYAESDPSTGRLVYRGTRKSSIDSCVQAELYRRLPKTHGFLHIHADAGIVIPDSVTTFPYPCGALEEADEVHRCVGVGPKETGTFAVELIHHGFLLGIERSGADRLRWEWRVASAAYRDHLEEIGRPDVIAELRLQPIFVSTNIVGVIATHVAEEWVSCFLLPEWRNGGHGERLMEALDRRGLTVKAHDLCKVAAYYVSHGWCVTRRDGNTALLIPPSRRTDLRPAASLCLVDPVSRQVLLGQRKTRTWNGLWAFPGGSLEPGDDGDLLAAAWREAREEMGIGRDRDLNPEMIVRTFVGTGDGGETAFRVTTFVY
ncbi:MAG: hypothetical protein RL272_1050, partial [Candidatus Parcubacteria bacterium]